VSLMVPGASLMVVRQYPAPYGRTGDVL